MEFKVNIQTLSTLVLYIKNMVCLRCKMAVESVLNQLGIGYNKVDLGRAVLKSELSPDEKSKLISSLQYYGLDLLENRKNILTERIKVLILELIYSSTLETRLKLSEYLSTSLNYDYTYLANIFSECEGQTIERFYIVNRVERVKELMVYEALTISEVAYQLHYSSVSHLCLQFKKVTGKTPSEFRKQCEAEDFVWKT